MDKAKSSDATTNHRKPIACNEFRTVGDAVNEIGAIRAQLDYLARTADSEDDGEGAGLAYILRGLCQSLEGTEAFLSATVKAAAVRS